MNTSAFRRGAWPAALYATGPVWAQDDHHPGETPAGAGAAPAAAVQSEAPTSPPGMPMMGADQDGAPMDMGGPGQGGMPMMGMGGPGQGGMPMMGMGGPGQDGMPTTGKGAGMNCMAMMQKMKGGTGGMGHQGGMKPMMHGQGMGQGVSRQELALIEARLAKIEVLLERLVQQR